MIFTLFGIGYDAECMMQDAGYRILDVECKIELNGMLSYPILSYPAKKNTISLKETKHIRSV